MANTQLADLSESFLHFLDDDNFNQNRETFCDEKSNLYHDSNYIWCKVCNKVFCTRCSLNHLINNQIDHNPADKIFLRKEHFDYEFIRDREKLNEIKKNIEEYFSQNHYKDFSQNEYNSIYKSLETYMVFEKELIAIIDNFQKTIQNAIDNIKNKAENIWNNNLREDNVKKYYEDICVKYTMIEKTFYNNKGFLPTDLKTYYDNLFISYNETKKLNDLIVKNKSYNDNVSKIKDECNKINNIINDAINNIKGCKLNLENFMNNIIL